MEYTKTEPLKDEPKVTFNLISDRTNIFICNDDIGENLVEISGYDLKINFNFQYIKSIEDVELASKGIAEVFQSMIMEQLLRDRKQNS